MKRIFSIISIYLLAISCNGGSANIENNGFDTACNIFGEALQKNLSPVELGIFIEDKLKAMPEQKAKQDVIDLFDLLFQADPSLRYQLFKESAEYSLKREWHCDSIKELYELK